MTVERFVSSSCFYTLHGIPESVFGIALLKSFRDLRVSGAVGSG